MNTLRLRIATLTIALLLAAGAAVLAQNASPHEEATISTLPPPVLKDPFRTPRSTAPVLSEPTLKNPFARALNRLSEPVLKDPFRKAVEVAPVDQRNRAGKRWPDPEIKNPFGPR